MVEFDIAQVHKEPERSEALSCAFSIIGKKWSAVIIDLLAQSECRFSQIAKCVPQLSDRMLSVRLSELEQVGLVEKNTYHFGQEKLTYRLSEKGMELAKALQDIERWSKKWDVQEI